MEESASGAAADERALGVPLPMLALGGIAAAVSLVAAVVAAAAGSAPSDFAVYLGAGRALGTGGSDLYSSLFAGRPFTYPPFAALLYAPLRGLSLTAASAVWSSLLVISLLLAILLIVRDQWGSAASTTKVWFIAFMASALGVWIEPVQSSLAFGQIDLIILLIVVADLVRVVPRLPPGVLIGIAAGVKLTPLLLVVYFLATRRFSEARNAAVAFIATIAIGFLALPHASVTFWRHTIFDTSRVASRPAWIVNSSLRGVLIRAWGDGVATHLAWLLISLVVVVVTFALVHYSEARVGHMTAGALVMLVACVVSPVAWDHHFVWVVVPLLLLISPRARHWPGKYVAFALLLLVFTVFDYTLWDVPLRYVYANDYSVALQALGAANVIAVLGLVGYVAAMVRRSPRGQRAEVGQTPPISV